MMRSKESLSVAPAVATILKQIEDGARPTAVCVMRARAAGAHGGINFPTPGLDEDAPDVVVTQVDSVLATDLRCARAALESMSGAARAVVLDLGLRVVWAQALQRGRALALERCIRMKRMSCMCERYLVRFRRLDAVASPGSHWKP
jgi:hypothetical protein